MAAHGLRVLGEMHVHLDDQLKRLESDIFAMNYAPGLDMGILEYADNTQLFQCLTAAHTAVTDARDRVRKLEYDLGERWLRLGQPATAEQWQAIAYTRRLALMNCLLHGMEGDAEGVVHVGNTLGSAGSSLPKSHIILSNPPFGTAKGGGDMEMPGRACRRPDCDTGGHRYGPGFRNVRNAEAAM